MQQVCAAPNLIRMKYPFKIILMGIKYLEKRPGPSRFGQFFQNLTFTCANWPSLAVPRTVIHPYKQHILHPYNTTLKGISFWIKFGVPQIWCIFEVRGHCAAPDWGRRKILGVSFTLGVRSIKNCCKKGPLKHLTTPSRHTQKISDTRAN